MMLKIWFPHVARQRTVSLTQTITPRLSSHWCQNQLHMPVKVSGYQMLAELNLFTIGLRRSHHMQSVMSLSPLQVLFIAVIFVCSFALQKRKLAWSEPGLSGSEPPRQKPRQPGQHESCQPALSRDPTSTCLHGGSKRQRAPWGAYVEQPGGPGFRDSTLGDRPSCPRSVKGTQQLDESPLSTCDHPVTQDNSVSSSAAITNRGSP